MTQVSATRDQVQTDSTRQQGNPSVGKGPSQPELDYTRQVSPPENMRRETEVTAQSSGQSRTQPGGNLPRQVAGHDGETQTLRHTLEAILLRLNQTEILVTQSSRQIGEFLQRCDSRHLDHLVQTLIGLRAVQRVHPDLVLVEHLADQISVLLENHFDLTESAPQHLDEFAPTSHRQVGEYQTNKASYIGRIKKTVRVGLTQNGRSFKNFYAEVIRYVAASSLAAQG